MANGMTRYILMHKNISVADIELDEATGAIFAIGHVYEALHVPVRCIVLCPPRESSAAYRSGEFS